MVAFMLIVHEIKYDVFYINRYIDTSFKVARPPFTQMLSAIGCMPSQNVLNSSRWL